MSSHVRVLPTLLVLVTTFFHGRHADAQLFQWTPEHLIKYTSKNPYDRFPDGRPKVPDEMIERLRVLVAEEVQAVLPARGFPNQFEPREGWKVLQPNQKMVGRVFTVQFMPARGDIIEVDEADAKAKGTTPARNQTAIDIHEVGIRSYVVPGLNAALGLPAAPAGAINDEVIDLAVTVYDKPFRAWLSRVLPGGAKGKKPRAPAREQG